jgi:hypothetical protein
MNRSCMSAPRRQSGALMIVAIVLIVVISMMATALSSMGAANTQSVSGHMQSDSALQVAQAGLEDAIFQYGQGTACASLVNTNVTIGAGSFTTSGTQYPSATTASSLSAAVSVTTPTNIPVTVTTGAIANYAPHGRIMIDSEEIDYSAISTSASVCGTAPCFVVWRRGANNSTAATHALGAAVIQSNQCVIRSTGTVSPAIRIMEAAVK